MKGGNTRSLGQRMRDLKAMLRSVVATDRKQKTSGQQVAATCCNHLTPCRQRAGRIVLEDKTTHLRKEWSVWKGDGHSQAIAVASSPGFKIYEDYQEVAIASTPPPALPPRRPRCAPPVAPGRASRLSLRMSHLLLRKKADSRQKHVALRREQILQSLERRRVRRVRECYGRQLYFNPQPV